MPAELERAWWFALPGQRPEGPATCSEIEEAIVSGALPHAFYVRPVDGEEWLVTSDVPRFQRAVERTLNEPVRQHSVDHRRDNGALHRYTSEDERPTMPSLKVRGASGTHSQWPSTRRRLADSGTE